MIDLSFLRPSHRSALKLLRRRVISPVPRAVCHGAALWSLETRGLIQKAGIPGYWGITDEGKTVDCDAEDFIPTKEQQIPWEPHGADRRNLLAAFAQIDRLKPGSIIFGGTVRKSALDDLFGKSRAQKFVYFSYPIGFPLKHIAWSCAADKPLWTDVNVSVVRGQVLGLPAMRHRAFDPVRTEEELLRRTLLEDGNSDWEVEEFFALRNRVAVL